MSKKSLPELTQQPINHVDGTPNEDYPLRILRAYRENCNCKFEANPPSPLIDIMNEHCERRAKILDKAIAALEADRWIDSC